MKKQKHGWLFLFLPFFSDLVFLLALSRRAGKQGKGTAKEKFPEHWTPPPHTHTPHEGMQKRKCNQVQSFEAKERGFQAGLGGEDISI